MMWTALLVTILLLLPDIYAYVNVTVDNDNPSILYQGIWGIVALTGYDYGGDQDLVDLGLNLTLPGANSTATFTFTGVAVYYMAPLWPYRVDSIVTLDSGTPVAINMTAPGQLVASGSTGATVVSSVLWGQTGLTNTQHELVVSLASGGRYVVVDAFIYTTVPPPASTLSSSGASSTSGSTSSTSNDSRVTTLIAVTGVLGGLLGLAIIAAIVFFIFRHRPTPRNPESLPTVSNPNLSPFPADVRSSVPFNEKGARLYAQSPTMSSATNGPGTSASASTNLYGDAPQAGFPDPRANQPFRFRQSDGASVTLTTVPPPYGQ